MTRDNMKGAISSPRLDICAPYKYLHYLIIIINIIIIRIQHNNSEVGLNP